MEFVIHFLNLIIIPDFFSLLVGALYLCLKERCSLWLFPKWFISSIRPTRIWPVPPGEHPMGEDHSSSDSELGMDSSSSQNQSSEDEGDEASSSEEEPIQENPAEAAPNAPEHVLAPDREARERTLVACLNLHNEDPSYVSWVIEQLRGTPPQLYKGGSGNSFLSRGTLLNVLETSWEKKGFIRLLTISTKSLIK